jgi:hypothetical protein
MLGYIQSPYPFNDAEFPLLKNSNIEILIITIFNMHGHHSLTWYH